MLTVGLAASVLSGFAYLRTQRSADFLSDQLQANVQEQAQRQLDDVARQQARAFDQFLQGVRDDVAMLAANTSALLAQQPVLGQGAYWDARHKLTRLSAGQWDNPNSDVCAVYLPSAIELSEAVISELNTGVYLDFHAPGFLQANPHVVAVYFINSNRATIYYPNTDLAALVGDLDPTVEVWYTIATPENNPGREPVWTQPYQDPALSGLLVTASAPVYDQAGEFRGVVGADVELAGIADDVSKVKVAQTTSYAFLIDSAGRIIAMPEAGYQDFGLTPEDVPINETPQQTLLGHGSPDLQAVVQHMTAGQSGLATLEIDGVQRYLAYAPLASVGYSLGVLAPLDEMHAPFIAASQRIADETTSTRRSGAFILALLLLFVLLVSLGLGRVLTAPLEHLTQTAHKIASGDLNVRAEVHTRDEIGVLATTFNRMTGQLRDSIALLEQRVAERTRALETSAEVSRRLSALLDQGQLAAQVVEQVQSAFGYYHSHIYLVDEANRSLALAGGTGEAGREMLASGYKIPWGRGLVGRAAATNAAVIVSDVSQDEDWLPNPLLPETRSEIAIPIAVAEGVLGVLDVQHNVVGGLDQGDADLLGSIAGQVAIALQNTRVFAETRQRAEREALVGQITRQIQSTTTIEGVVQTAARELSRALGAQRASVQLSYTAQPADEE
jgi:putative methionine-R-sulfoxide reductase with GAF domain